MFLKWITYEHLKEKSIPTKGSEIHLISSSSLLLKYQNHSYSSTNIRGYLDETEGALNIM